MAARLKKLCAAAATTAAADAAAEIHCITPRATSRMPPRVLHAPSRSAHSAASTGDARAANAAYHQLAPSSSSPPTAAQQKAARHVAKTSLPQVCSSLLLAIDQISSRESSLLALTADRARAAEVHRAVQLLELLAACARLAHAVPAAKLLPLCEQAADGVGTAAAAAAAVRQACSGGRLV
jgi:hypothetical protein